MFRKRPDPQGETITVFLDGVPVAAWADDSVAAVLLRQDPAWSRTTAVSGVPRAPYCMMGVCFECLTTVNGVTSVQACMRQAVHGMRIVRQRGCPEVTQ